MKKRWVALIAFAAFAVGVGGASWIWLGFMNLGLKSQTEVDIVTRVAVLEHIRAGRIDNAKNLLETLIDGDLVTVAALARDGAKFNQKASRAAALEFEARKDSGYAPNDENVRREVQDAFHVLAKSDASGAN